MLSNADCLLVQVEFSIIEYKNKETSHITGETTEYLDYSKEKKG